MEKLLAAVLLCTALSGCIIQPMPYSRTVYYQPAYAPPPVYAPPPPVYYAPAPRVYYAPPPPPRYFGPGGGYGYGYRHHPGPPPNRPFRPWN